MVFDHSLVAALRTGKNFTDKWGLYSVQRDRWMDVVYQSEEEANAAIAIIKARPSQDVASPVKSRKRGYGV
ncbi:hypothetical protein [Sphingomonas glacialis]|uniref:hypothetical protein n=1 Tax=Sphingomonas glacialis TaxID=658225 RepID=UPI00112C34D8|nr:hypothetical protein [Sphingomonas glacialis]